MLRTPPWEMSVLPAVDPTILEHNLLRIDIEIGEVGDPSGERAMNPDPSAIVLAILKPRDGLVHARTKQGERLNI